MQRETACRLVHYHHIMRSMDQGRVRVLPVWVLGVCPPGPGSVPRLQAGFAGGAQGEKGPRGADGAGFGFALV